MSMVHTDAVFFEDDKAFESWLVDNASVWTIDMAAPYGPGV